MHLVDIICIGHIKIYLARNFSYVLHSLVRVMDIICIGYNLHSLIMVLDIVFIGHITSYLPHNVYPIFHIYSSSVSEWWTE